MGDEDNIRADGNSYLSACAGKEEVLTTTPIFTGAELVCHGEFYVMFCREVCQFFCGRATRNCYTFRTRQIFADTSAVKQTANSVAFLGSCERTSVINCGFCCCPCDPRTRCSFDACTDNRRPRIKHLSKGIVGDTRYHALRQGGFYRFAERRAVERFPRPHRYRRTPRPPNNPARNPRQHIADRMPQRVGVSGVQVR